MNIFNRFSARGILIFMFIVISTHSYGQIFKGEVLLGGTLSQVEGDMLKGYKKGGFCGGLGIQFPFHFNPKSEAKPWAVSMEILFSQRGSRQRNYNYDPANNTPGLGTEYKFKYLLKNYYVCLPFMLHYTDKEWYTIGAGLSYNRLVSSEEIEFDVQQTYDTVDRFKPYDFMFVLDLRCRIWRQLKAGFRFEYSITPIRTRAFQESTFRPDKTLAKQYNNTLSLYLMYVFNEKITDTKEKRERKERIYYY